MTRTSRSALALATVTVLAGIPDLAGAQEPHRSPVRLVIERLSQPSPDKAEAEIASLVRGGAASAKVLRRALRRCSDPRFVERAKRALALCEVDAPVLNGLKIGLSADRAEIRPGDTVRFTARLCNVGDEPIVLYTGMSYSGSVFENGLALQRWSAGAETQARFGAVGFCGTGARPLTVEIEPLGFREFEFEASYLDGPGNGQLIPSQGRRLVIGYVYLDLGDDEQLTLRLRHSVRLDRVGGMVKPEKKPDWQGSITSNEVLLRARR